MLNGTCKLSLVWGFDRFCVVTFNVLGVNYRIRFAVESLNHWNSQVGKEFNFRKSGTTMWVNPYGFDDPNRVCWLQAERGI